MKQQMTFLFNNCAGRDHADAFNQADAFFDLGIDGHQATQATELTIGEQCVVAQAANAADEIQFDSFLLESIKLLPDKYTGATCRVFCGLLLRSETLSRVDAHKHPLYGAVLNKNAHFKRTSVVSVDI